MARTHRVKGSGSIFYHEGRGRWMAQCSLTDPHTGKIRKVTRSARTAKEAQALLTQLQATATPAKQEAMTVHKWMDWYVDVHMGERLGRGEIRPATAQSAQSRVGRWRQMAPPTVGLDDLDATQLELVKARYAQSSYSPATQARDLGQLVTIMDLAVYHGLIKVNKVKVLRKPSVPAKPRPILTPGQVKALLADVKGHWLEPWYVLAIPSGARCMEICGMTWDRIDLDAGVMAITHQLVDRHGGLRLEATKTGREGDVRRVPLAGWQIDRLARIRVAQEKAAKGPDWIGNPFGLAVVTPRGRAVYNQQVAKDLRARVEALGLPPVTPHSFRRTAISLVLAEGVDLATAMKVMGWKTSSVPLEVYAQLTEQGFDRVRGVFDGLAG